MSTYVILVRVSPGSFKDSKDVKEAADAMLAKLKSDCPDVVWKDSYATMGRFDFVDIVEADDPKKVQKAAMIINAYAHATTETLLATPWQEFYANL